MSEIIQFVTGEELASLLGVMGQQVSGMTPQEAYNALHMVESGKMVSGNVITGGSKIIQFTNGSASEAVELYVANGGTISSTGAATSSSLKTANLTVIKGASGATGVAGILSMSLPTWAAAVAPLIGVALGTGLYSLNPDFWEKISRTLLPFAWSDTQVMPMIVDENGQVYAQAAAINSLAELLSSSIKEGLHSDLDTGPYSMPIATTKTLHLKRAPYYSSGYGGDVWTEEFYDFPTPTYVCLSATSGQIAFISASTTGQEKGTLHRITRRVKNDKVVSDITFDHSAPSRRSYTVDGKKVFFGSDGSVDEHIGAIVDLSFISSTVIFVDNDTYIRNVAWTMCYGAIENVYEEGTSKWGGEPVTDPSVGKIDVITDSEGNLAPYYPVTLPVGDVPPGESNNPEVVPRPNGPTPLPDLTPHISPIINPDKYPIEFPYPGGDQNTAPLPNPIPSTNPNLDPSADPSKKPEPSPDPEPAEDNKPSSSGSSPPAFFPPLEGFPSIIPSSGSGLIHVYNLTPEEMISFGKWLWVTYADADIHKIWNNPFDGVISAHELYATPAVSGRDNIRSGFLTCPTTANLVRVRYTQINCGSVVMPEWYSNYLDYSPYTKASVYLPFIGIVELDPDDIVGHGINITYTIDSYNGSCIAQITVAKQGYNNTVYQFSGNCSVELPLAGGSQAAIKAGLISAAATGITSVIGGVASLLTGNIPGAIGGIAHGVGSAVSTAVSQKSTVQHSGSFGASYGAMGIKKPYLIIRRPIQKQVTNYNEDYGFPAHKRVLIGNCSGYLRAKEVHVVSPTATDEEKSMIESLLKHGVFVS